VVSPEGAPRPADAAAGSAPSSSAGTAGRIVQINVGSGGVPKHPVLAELPVRVTREGLAGDRQEDRRYHGGPERAVSCFSAEVIARLAAEGHPIAPGTTGENLTIAGLDWAGVQPGVRLILGRRVALEVTSFAAPCRTIRGSFRDADYERISEKRHPGESRVYCRVLHEGELRAGDAVDLEDSRFLNHVPIKGVNFEHNDSVRILSGPHAGEVGSLVSVKSLEPEPLFVVELASGRGDVRAPQSALVRVE
jgi:MOSC domain-containing protein YiiM